MAKQAKFDKANQPLVPGALYVCGINNIAYGSSICHEEYTDLVFYGADDRFYDADSGEECDPFYDFLVRQAGAFDASYAEAA